MGIDTVLETRIDYIWILLCGALVIMMQAGFMCLESGLASAKNSINIAIKNLADFIASSILFWAVGFGLMFGRTLDGWAGASHFLLGMDDPWISLIFFFQVAFAGTSATIVSGSVSGRTKFSAYLIISCAISGLVYPVFGHWAWGGLLHGDPGWLQARGFKDFAGATVVHSVGAWMALAAVIVIGPRIGKFSKSGEPNPISPHNMTFAYLGGFILLFGWFGFNCGSTLKATTQIGGIAFKTLLGGSFGCLTSSMLSWALSPFRRPRGEMIINGLLGGLVAITAGCAYVGAKGAIATGAVAGVIAYWGFWFVERVLKLDDVVGAIPVHGFCGAWGTLAVGLFILPEHLDGMARADQLLVQAMGVGACFAWTFGTGLVLLKIIDRLSGGMRVSRKAELLGLNISEHGASSSLLDLVEAMRVATQRGDFSDTVKIEVEIGTEMGDLARGFNRMVDTIQEAITETRRQVQIAEAARDRAEAAQWELGENRRRHVETVAEIGRSLSEMMRESEQTLGRIHEAAAAVMNDVDDLICRSGEIDEMLELIRNISFSMKILSVNAVIEAARAGEAGNSFAVVAQDMGGLNHRIQEAARTIEGLTSNIQERIRKTVSSVETQYASVTEGKEKILKAAKLVQSLLEDHGSPATTP